MPGRLEASARWLLRAYPAGVEDVVATCTRCRLTLFVELTVRGGRPALVGTRELAETADGDVVHAGSCGGRVRLYRPHSMSPDPLGNPGSCS